MPNPKNRRPVALSPDAASQVRDVVHRVKSTPWSGDPRRGRVNTWNPGVMRAKCTSAIPTGTFDSPGMGQVQIYVLDRGADAWIESGDPVDCYNQFALDASVAAGTACFVAWISGQWWLVNAECPET